MPWTREQLAERAARELHDGFYVNLGIGIPTLVGNYIRPEMKVVLQSENGITDLAVFERPDRKSPFKLVELAPGVTVDEIKAKTSAKFV
jgi:3-oxoacid CoA-transferase subunit B